MGSPVLGPGAVLGVGLWGSPRSPLPSAQQVLVRREGRSCPPWGWGTSGLQLPSRYGVQAVRRGLLAQRWARLSPDVPLREDGAALAVCTAPADASGRVMLVPWAPCGALGPGQTPFQIHGCKCQITAKPRLPPVVQMSFASLQRGLT